ncbi:MAG: hypothetical protein QF574_08605 [Arenicellales bacterium]|jgi:hypothetical protein|nr:hypothetical protein [Arenicellales bacterium]
MAQVIHELWMNNDSDSIIVDPEVAEKHLPKDDPKPGDDPDDLVLPQKSGPPL